MMSGVLALDEKAMVASSSALSNGMSCVLTVVPGTAVRILSAIHSSAGKRWLIIWIVSAAPARRMKGVASVVAPAVPSSVRRVIAVMLSPPDYCRQLSIAPAWRQLDRMPSAAEGPAFISSETSSCRSAP